MKLYLYCSYTHSKRGFVLSEVSGDELIPVSLMGAQDRGKKILENFFTYDTFRILWQEFSQHNSIPLFPGSDGAVFGMRGLIGKISDRDGVINFAVLADKGEVKSLWKLAAGILADPEGFVQSLSSCLSIGGNCGYQADAGRIWALLKCIQTEHLPAVLQHLPNPRSKPYSVRDQLRLAVYIGNWEQASEYMIPHWIWKSCPKQAICHETFAEYLGRDPWNWRNTHRQR